MPRTRREGMGEEITKRRGEWRDQIVVRKGRGSLTDECLRAECEHTPEQHREMVETEVAQEESHNLVVTSIGIAIAVGVKGDFSPPNIYHAMGTGLPAWDISLPSEVVSQTTLLTEAFRKKVGAINHLDQMPPGESVVGGPTQFLQFMTTVDFGEGNGNDFREHGLFGANATLTFDSGAMMDAIHHAKITKNNTFQLIRTISMGF